MRIRLVTCDYWMGGQEPHFLHADRLKSLAKKPLIPTKEKNQIFVFILLCVKVVVVSNFFRGLERLARVGRLDTCKIGLEM